jgi:hypothetical protein
MALPIAASPRSESGRDALATQCKVFAISVGNSRSSGPGRTKAQLRSALLISSSDGCPGRSSKRAIVTAVKASLIPLRVFGAA